MLTGSKPFRDRMLAHEVSGVRELSEGPIDAALTVTRHLHALSLWMSAAVDERENTSFDAGERRLDTLNPQITSGAFQALGYLAALANFYVCEAACSHRD